MKGDARMERDLLVFSGQSNMQGQSGGLLDDDVVEGAVEYRMLTDQLIPLRDPVGEDILKDGTAGYPFREAETPNWHLDQGLARAVDGCTTLIPAFCRAYLRETGGAVAAVPASKGATCVEEWLPGTVGYSLLMKKFRMALERVEETDTAGHRYLVWLQGESDAIAETPRRVYMERMRSLSAALRRDAGIELFGIIRVGRFTYDDRDLQIMAAQDELCRSGEGFLMLTDLAAGMSMDPAWINPRAQGHFNPEALVRLGTEAGRTLGRLRMRENGTREK